MKYCTFLLILFSGINTSLGQYIQNDISLKEPVYGNSDGILYAHFLNDETIVISRKGEKNPYIYELYSFDGTNFILKKDITEHFYIKNNKQLLAIQPLKDRDFFYARPAGLGLVKTIDYNGKVLNTFNRSRDVLLSGLSKKEKESMQFDSQLGYNFLKPDIDHNKVYGYFYSSVLPNDNWVSRPNSSLKSGGKIDDPYYTIENSPHFLSENSPIDYQRKCVYSTISEGSTITQKKLNYYFVKKDYSNNELKTSYYGRGINQNIWSKVVNETDNVAYVGYEDGVVDKYDLSSNEFYPFLKRIDRMYLTPYKKVIKIDYLKGSDLIVCAETPNIEIDPGGKKSLLEVSMDILKNDEAPPFRPNVVISVCDIKSSKQLYILKSKQNTWAFQEHFLMNLEFSPKGNYVLAVGVNDGKSNLQIWKLK